MENNSNSTLCSTVYRRNQWAVDSYIDHADLEEKMNQRVNDGYELYRLIPCEDSHGRSYCTIVWNAGHVVSYTTTTFSPKAWI